jgi:NhaA family Na+:H+ antiporter
MDDPHSPLHRLEHVIDPWVGYGVVPIFGFANAGVSFAGLDASALVGPVPVGIALGLIVGKQIGVFGTAWATVRLGYADKPDGATMPQLYAVALLCGIGFTMSLFIGGLAFSSSPELSDAMKIGLLASARG